MPSPRIAVVRFSALGDVVLLWPVLCALSEAHPTHRITFFTRPRIAEHLPTHPNIEVVGLDVDQAYASPVALFLFWWGWLRSTQPVAWVDAHHHVRTWSGTWLARRMGIPVGQIQKHRGDRKSFLRREIPTLRPIQEIYAHACAQAGFPVAWPPVAPPAPRTSSDLLLLAPFAAHASKRWDVEDASKLASRWLACGGRVALMGHPNEFEAWPGPPVLLAQREEEVHLWAEAAVAVVMDSANQHLAALHGTPSVTLWMGTAPEAGFVPYHPGLTAHVRPGDLACTPCSIYGTSTCSRGDFACRKLSAQDIADAIRRVARTDLDLSAL